MRNVITVLREEKGLSLSDVAGEFNLSVEEYKFYETNSEALNNELKAKIINFLIR